MIRSARVDVDRLLSSTPTEIAGWISGFGPSSPRDGDSGNIRGHIHDDLLRCPKV